MTRWRPNHEMHREADEAVASASAPPRGSGWPARKTALALFSALGLLLVLESVVQVRSHLRNGQSVFNALTQETRYVTDPETGLKVLRPNHVFRGSEAEIRTNRYGLRSPEINLDKAPGTIRLAVLGASTVMGAYAARNEDTFAMRLDTLLEETYPDRDFEVINAGIAGYGLAEQATMLEKRILPLDPDLVIVYPGFNDFAGYCRETRAAHPKWPQRQGLAMAEAPAWLLSVELLTKNTVALRTPPVSTTQKRSAEDIDRSEYREKLELLGEVAARSEVPVVLSTNARAYRPEQPEDEQLALSETARYYNPCFDLEDLHALYDAHNDEIRSAAERFDLPVVSLDEEIPGGHTYFADASHFSNAGEQRAAERLRDFIVLRDLIPLSTDP